MSSRLKIIVDTREPDVMVALLMKKGLDVERLSITPGDYIVSDGCAVERKTVGDFFNSLFQGRLFEQMERLKDAYPQPILLMEGGITHELAGRRNPRAFWGALLNIEVDMNIPTVVTMDPVQSSDALYVLVRRMQLGRSSQVAVRSKPKILSERELQLYIVEGLPNIGGELAKRLLSRFNSVRDVFQASQKELVKVEGIGHVRARKINKIIDKEYKERKSPVKRASC